MNEYEESAQRACEMSMQVQDLFMHNDPSAKDMYSAFYLVALSALELLNNQLNQNKAGHQKIVDDVNSQLAELQAINERIDELEPKVIENEKKIQENEALSEGLKEKIKNYKQKNMKFSEQPNIVEIIKNIEEMQVKIEESWPVLKENQKKIQCTYEKNEMIKKEIHELEDSIIRMRKKHQIRKSNLLDRLNKINYQAKEMKLKPSKQEESQKEVIEESASPPIVIYKTSTSSQDTIRHLKTALEEVLKKNGELKTQLNDVSAELEAVYLENESLKMVTRAFVEVK